MKLEPMKYHGPGWNLEIDDGLFQVWAPNEKRFMWCASISYEGGYHGSFSKGTDLQDAMTKARFPDSILKIFLDNLCE